MEIKRLIEWKDKIIIFKKMWKNGRLYHSSLNGKVGTMGLPDDYSFQIEALVELYQAGFDIKRIEQAEMVAQVMIELFLDDENGEHIIFTKCSSGL